MSKFVWKLLLASPAALAASGLVGGAAMAAQEPTAETTVFAPVSSEAVAPAPLLAANQLAVNQPTVAQPFAAQPVQPEVPVSPAPAPLLSQSLRNTPSVAELEEPIPAVPTTSAAPNSAAQVTSVGQLADVKPTDWAYQAVQSLVERYGCLVGYPNSTFRGNRAATRYELAAALNACMDMISDRFATKEDLLAVRKLMEEFAKELAALKGRVNQLETRTAKLESQQFSTTTKLVGGAVFSLSDALLGTGTSTNPAIRDRGDNPIVTYRVRLNLNTSFTGKDLLFTRLQASNVPSFGAGAPNGLGLSNSSRLNYDVAGNPTTGDGVNTAGEFTFDKLYYRFPVFGKGVLQVDAFRAEIYSAGFYPFNPFLDSDDRGSLSRFFRFNPLYRAAGDSGFSFTYPVIRQDDRDLVRLNVGYYGGSPVVPGSTCTAANASYCYGSGNPRNPFPGGSGLFGGAYSAITQVDVAPLKNLRFGLLYSHTYGIDVSGGTGTALASNPLGQSVANPLGTRGGNRTLASDNFGFNVTYRIIPKLNLAGWVGYSRAYNPNPGISQRANILNWGVTLASPDLWRKGDLISLSFGQAPSVISSNAPNGTDPFKTYVLEGQYRFQVNDNISVTPGLIAVFNPNGDNFNGDNRDTALIGVIRTTFTF
jgi:hypothetical protein